MNIEARTMTEIDYLKDDRECIQKVLVAINNADKVEKKHRVYFGNACDELTTGDVCAKYKGILDNINKKIGALI